jgi:1,3-beta-glucanosyltransferase GAS1
MLQKNASGYSIPIFMSETGCNTPAPRLFQDQAAILGPEMSGTWSGTIIYEWIQEANNYGLISYGPPTDPTQTGGNVMDGFTRAGTPTPISPDFENLSSQWATLNPTGVMMKNYEATETPPPCPAYTSGMWEVSGNAPLPTLGQTGTKYTLQVSTINGGTPTAGSLSSTTASSAASATKAASLAGRKEAQVMLVGVWAAWVLGV